MQIHMKRSSNEARVETELFLTTAIKSNGRSKNAKCILYVKIMYCVCKNVYFYEINFFLLLLLLPQTSVGWSSTATAAVLVWTLMYCVCKNVYFYEIKFYYYYYY